MNINGIDLVNPDEIYDFISDKEDIVDLIQKTHVLIKEYFPESDLYLKLHDNPEYECFESKLFTHIINKGNSAYETACIFDDFLSDFVDLKRNYPDLIDVYSISIDLKS